MMDMAGVMSPGCSMRRSGRRSGTSASQSYLGLKNSLGNTVLWCEPAGNSSSRAPPAPAKKTTEDEEATSSACVSYGKYTGASLLETVARGPLLRLQRKRPKIGGHQFGLCIIWEIHWCEPAGNSSSRAPPAPAKNTTEDEEATSSACVS